MNLRNVIKSFLNNNPDIDPMDSLINLDEIIKDATNTNSSLLGKSMKDINTEIYNEVGGIEELYNKLKDNYYLITDINDLRSNRFIRWLKIVKDENNEETLQLTNGGFFVKLIKNRNNNQYKALCKFNRGIFFSFYFDDTIVFQKISPVEKMILMSNSNDTDDDDDDETFSEEDTDTESDIVDT
jgi:hypothetical protein